MSEGKGRIEGNLTMLRANADAGKVALEGTAAAYTRCLAELSDLEAKVSSAEIPTEAELAEWDRQIAALRQQIRRLSPVAARGLWFEIGSLAALFGVGLLLHISLLDLVFLADTHHANGELILFSWAPGGGIHLAVSAVQLISMSLLAAIWGAAGGIVATIVGMAEGSSAFSPSFGVSWVVKPLRGAFVGVMLFMLVQAGLLTTTAGGATQALDQGFDINAREAFFIFAMAAMAGYQERLFLKKISDVLKAVFGADGEAAEKGTSEPTPLPKGGQA